MSEYAPSFNEAAALKPRKRCAPPPARRTAAADGFNEAAALKPRKRMVVSVPEFLTE